MTALVRFIRARERARTNKSPEYAQAVFDEHYLPRTPYSFPTRDALTVNALCNDMARRFRNR